MPTYDRLKGLLDGFMSISLGVRLLIGTALGALGSSTLIGFIAELGAVNYALAYGVRLPTEGVPYVRYATMAISLAIFAIAFSVLLVVHYLMTASVRMFLSSFSTAKERLDAEKVPLRVLLIKGLLPAFLATQLIANLIFLLTQTVPNLQLNEYWGAPAVVLVATLLVLVFGRRPAWLKWFTISVFVAAILAFLVAAFTPSLYGRALYYARLGGGLDVRLQMNCFEKNPCESEITGSLFIRTSESLVLRDSGTQQIREVPKSLC